MNHSAVEESAPLVLPFAHPLDEFYADAGRNLPRIDIVPGENIPSPYQQLLVHDGDMTPTLEKFHRSTIHLEVIRREQHGDFYFRQVLLITELGRKKVEFGAIKIYLALFPRPVRNEILAERIPLGTILAHYAVAHHSRPKAYFRVYSDQYINRVFSLNGTHCLYGRRNTLSNLDGHSLAEIVEILPPLPAAKSSEPTR